MFLQECVHAYINRKKVFDIVVPVLEGSLQLQSTFKALTSINKAAKVMSGPLMAIAICAIRNDVKPGPFGDDIEKQQAMLTMFFEDITFADQTKGYAAAWPKSPNDTQDRHQTFLACISVYALRRFLLSLPAAATNLSNLMWKRKKFDKWLLETLGFLDQIQQPSDLDTAMDKDVLSEIVRKIECDVTKHFALNAIQAISDFSSLDKSGRQSFLDSLCKDMSKTTEYRVVAGLLVGMFPELVQKPVLTTEIDKQLLLTCALLHNEVLVFIFLPCFENLLSIDVYCVPLCILYYIDEST